MILVASSLNGGSYASVYVGKGWIAFANSVILIFACIASTASPIISPAFGPTTDAPTSLLLSKSAINFKRPDPFLVAKPLAVSPNGCEAAA